MFLHVYMHIYVCMRRCNLWSVSLYLLSGSSPLSLSLSLSLSLPLSLSLSVGLREMMLNAECRKIWHTLKAAFKS